MVELGRQLRQFDEQYAQYPLRVALYVAVHVIQKLLTRQVWQAVTLNAMQRLEPVVMTYPMAHEEHVVPVWQVKHPGMGQLVQLVELQTQVAVGEPYGDGAKPV